MLASTLINYCKLNGVIYDFPQKGDTLPMHSHGEADVHITVVAKGSFLPNVK
jgi:hypothetical protein